MIRQSQSCMPISTICGARETRCEYPVTVFADPDQFQFLDCEQLAAQRTARRARVRELKLLMDKAEQSTGGTFVNAIAYEADYVTAQEDLKVMEASAHVKKCSTPENWRSNSAVE